MKSIRLSGLTLLVSSLLIVSLPGCQSRSPQRADVLPEEPIAFVHWEGKVARKRGEVFENAAGQPPLPGGKADSEELLELQIRAHLEGQPSYAAAASLAKAPGHLKLFWPRTGEIERIEAAPPNARPLAWRDNHQILLFASQHRDDRMQLYEYHLDRQDLSVVTVGPDQHARADYDRTGRLVIQRTLSGSRSGGGSEGARANRHAAYLASSTGRLDQLVGAGVRPGTLRTTPMGEEIVYEQIKTRPRSVGAAFFESFIAIRRTAAGSAEKILTRGREPTLTPDGQWIVFASPSPAGYRLRRMRLDGTSRVAMSPFQSSRSAGEGERMPSVSPDGEYVAFIAEKGSARRLAIRSFDGQSTRILLPKGWSEFPVW